MARLLGSVASRAARTLCNANPEKEKHMLQQIGLSPKIITDLVVSVAAFFATKYGLDLDATLSALIAKGAGSVAAWAAGPGTVVPADRILDKPPVPDAVDKPDVVA